jgi:hypothetical protein
VPLCPHIHAADSLTQEFTSIQELEGILCAGMEEGWQVCAAHCAAHVCRSTHELDAPPSTYTSRLVQYIDNVYRGSYIIFPDSQACYYTHFVME